MWMLSILGTATAEPSRLSPIFINTWPCSMCGQGGHVANGLCARDKYDGCKPLRSGIYSCVNAWGVQKVQSCHATHASNQFHDPMTHHDPPRNRNCRMTGWQNLCKPPLWERASARHNVPRLRSGHLEGTVSPCFTAYPFLSSRSWKLLVTQELEIYTPKGAIKTKSSWKMLFASLDTNPECTGQKAFTGCQFFAEFVHRLETTGALAWTNPSTKVELTVTTFGLWRYQVYQAWSLKHYSWVADVVSLHGLRQLCRIPFHFLAIYFCGVFLIICSVGILVYRKQNLSKTW